MIDLRVLPLLIPLLSFASGNAFAQFSVEGGRGDRPTGGMERGGGMRDEGIGIGVGIGIELGKAAVEQAARDKATKGGGGSTSPSTTPPRRAARKGGGDGPVNAKQPRKDEAKKDEPPTPLPQDPKDGIDVPGGKVHRGTGTVPGYQGGDRKGIFCWVHTTDKEKCKKFAQYQFVTVNFEAKWGNDPQANVNDAVKKLRANTGGFLPTTDNGNGVRAMPGQVIGDDYADTRNVDPVNLKDDDGNNVKDPNGKEIKGGAQHSQKIPGGGGDQGLVDAPYWPPTTIGGFANGLAPDSLRKQTKVQPKQPDESEAGTIKVLQHFRTYVYCVQPKTCLGYFDWDYNQTFTIAMKWTESQKKGDVADQTFGDNMSGSGGSKKKGKGQPAEEPEKTWVPYFEAKGTPTVDGPTIGEWKPCP